MHVQSAVHTLLSLSSKADLSRITAGVTAKWKLLTSPNVKTKNIKLLTTKIKIVVSFISPSTSMIQQGALEVLIMLQSAAPAQRIRSPAMG